MSDDPKRWSIPYPVLRWLQDGGRRDFEVCHREGIWHVKLSDRAAPRYTYASGELNYAIETALKTMLDPNAEREQLT